METERYFLDGPGETLIVYNDFVLATPDPDKIIAVISSKRGSFTYGVTEEKVTGGRGVVPRRKFTTEKDITFELEDCETDFRYFLLSQGITPATSPNTDVWAYGIDFKYYLATTQLSADLGYTPSTNTLMVKNGATGATIPYGAATPVGATLGLTGSTLTGGAYYDATPTEIECMFKYASTLASNQIASMSLDDVPTAVTIIHTQPMFDENNAITGKQQLEIFKALPSQEFNEAYQEKQAYAPVLKFSVIDPRRPDKKILDKKLLPIK